MILARFFAWNLADLVAQTHQRPAHEAREANLSNETESRALALAAEYWQIVDAMRSGEYDGSEEHRELSAQRTVLHDELIALTGVTDRKAMYGHCRDLLRSGA